jgi:SNF2 family DNA or RNA helicase
MAAVRYRYDLHEYQKRAIQFIMDTKRCALWLDMGLGKTTSTLTAISDLKDSFAVAKVLVIAPLRVANTVWKQEAAQWHHLRHLDVAICTGTERNRISVLQRDADVYVINRENVEWLVNHYKKKWPFDCVVIDESSSFKNATSKRFKALKKILPMTEYMVLLTGTPSPNGLLDLWPQTYLIDQGEALGRTMTAFKQRYFETDYMGYKHTPRSGSPERIYELLAPMTISMSAEDYLELPDRIDLIESVELSPAAMRAYQVFEDTLLAQLPDGDMVEAMNAAVLANKLLQNANGALYTDTLGNWSEVHSTKLDALVDLVEQNSGENLLVAYNYKSDLERIQKKFPYAKVLDKDPQTVVDWNAGRIKILLAHPASAGHGLNLQQGGSMIIWFAMNWSLELYQQFNARLHRQGQDKPVRIVHMVVNKTIDERVMSVLASKDKSQSALLEALKPKGK